MKKEYAIISISPNGSSLKNGGLLKATVTSKSGQKEYNGDEFYPLTIQVLNLLGQEGWELCSSKRK